MDLIATDEDHDARSDAVRIYLGSHLYEFIEEIKPHVHDLLRSDMASSSAMALAATQVLRTYLQALKDLGKLYQTDKPPAVEEEMIPASQLPMLVEKAVEAEVSIAVQEALEKQREDALEQARLSSDEAKARVRMVLGQIAKRS